MSVCAKFVPACDLGKQKIDEGGKRGRESFRSGEIGSGLILPLGDATRFEGDIDTVRR
jgi:hypothetical protein